MQLFRKTWLYFEIIWNHVVFWSFPTPEENYYLKLGTSYFYLQHYKKAISLLERSETAHNYEDSVYSKYNCLYLGYCYLNLGNFHKTVEYFEKYVRFTKNPEVLYEMASCYMSINRPLDALRICLQGTIIEPELPAWNIECARIMIELNRNDEVSEHLKLAETKTKDPSEQRFISSLQSKLAGHMDKAIQILKDLITNLDDSTAPGKRRQTAQYYMILYSYQKEIKDNEGLLNSVEKAFENNPADMWIINALAMEYAEQKINLEKALMLINRALRYQSENPFFFDTKGLIFIKMGKIEEAKYEIKKSLALYPEYKDAIEHYDLITSLQNSH